MTQDTHTVLTELVARMKVEVSNIHRLLDELGSDSVDDYKLGQISAITHCISLVEEKRKELENSK